MGPCYSLKFVTSHIPDLRRFMSQARRLLIATRHDFWRWIPVLIASQLGSLDIWLALRLGHTQTSIEDGVLCLSFPGRETVFWPISPGGIFHGAVEEAFMLHWRDVRLLDQYNARPSLGAGMVVVDVGANVGCFTMLASKVVEENGRVIAIEAIEKNFSCLQKTVDANRLTNVVPLQLAVGERDGEIAISLSQFSGNHSAVLRRSDVSVTVPMRSLDSIVTQLGLRRIDFIKVDVEGMEPEVLRGATETIRRFRPVLAISAYHLPEHRESLPRILHEIEPTYNTEIKRLAGLEEVMLASPFKKGRPFA